MIINFLQILVGLFFAILFLQSGLDKVIHFKGNKGYIQSVFEQTPLRGLSSLLFIAITAMETIAGLLTAGGVLYYLATGERNLILWGLQVSSMSLLCLFFGQRMAKDYAGAASLVPYFILSLLGIASFLIGG